MITKVGFKSNLSFGEALSTKELKEYEEASEKASKIIGPQDKSILVVHDACLPQSAANNTGAGHLTSKESGHFFDVMKAYLGINTVELLPPGRPNPDRGGYCAYASTGFSLGEHQINPELLMTPEYGGILKQEEFDEIVSANTDESIQSHVKGNDVENPIISKETIVNFENIIDDNSPFDKSMRKAYDRFQNSSDAKVVELKKQFDAYKTQNEEILEPKGIFEVLRKEHGTIEYESWENETDRELYNPDFDEAKRQARKAEILNDPAKAKEVDFYKFKQFIADEHLKKGRADLNSKGLKLFGDCLIGFSKDETWANPKAFEKGMYIGLPEWKLPALDYEKLKDPNSQSSKVLKRKVEFFAKRYDSIRFDVSWAYIAPKISPKGATAASPSIYQGSHILDMIDKTVKDIKEAKGEKFDPKDLIHEFEDGDIWEKSNLPEANLLEPVKSRTKVFGSTYLHADEGNGWGTNAAFLRRDFGGADGFVIGVGNHDPMPLRQLAEVNEADNSLLEKWADNECKNKETKDSEKVTVDVLRSRKEDQIGPLAKIFGVDEDSLRTNVSEFINTKFAEPVMAKNNMVFYTDVLGRRDRFDCQDKNSAINYRFRITDKFESEYHKALQDGRGFNKMDSFARIFKARKLDEQHPELYQTIVKLRDKLIKKGVTTEEEANKAAAAIRPTEPASDTISSEVANASKKTSKNKFIIAAVAALAILGGFFAFNASQKDAPVADKNKNTIKA